MSDEYRNTVKDCLAWWMSDPDNFMRAYDLGLIEHTQAVEEAYEAILAFGSDQQKGGETWQDKNKYK